MYYVPQMSPLPPELTVESFVTDLTIKELQKEDERPYFGYVSFVGPHPPCAPPAPYHLLYNPDVMENPYRGEEAVDCIGRILDELESQGELENTVICFTADHGDHLGDHGAWQKESFFEQSTRVPFIVCAPGYLEKGARTMDLTCLTDLYAIITKAGGCLDAKEGVDILGGDKRTLVFGTYGIPGTDLFNQCNRPGLLAAIDGEGLKAFDYSEREPKRIHQFEFSKNITDFEVSTDNFFVSP